MPRRMFELTERFADLSTRLEYVLVYLVVGVAILLSVPVLNAVPTLVPTFLGAVSVLGTLVYVRFGFLIVREECPTCGGKIGLGTVWCPMHRGIQPRFTHLGLQFIILVVATYVVGATMGLSFTVLSSVQPFGGSLFDAVAGSGYGFFRTYIGLYGMIAAVPIPVVVGSLVRTVCRAPILRVCGSG